MKKFYKMFTCVLAVLALSITMLPSASALFRDRLYYYGKVEEIERGCGGQHRIHSGLLGPERELSDDHFGQYHVGGL